MADDTTPTVPPQTPGVVPGNQTSEYRITIIATVLSVAATVTGVVLDLLQSAQDAGVNGRWLSIGLAVFGVIGAVLTAVGYQVTRAHVKAAAVAASGAKPIIPPDKAAANLGQV
jgi:hypothetical protein